MDDFVLTSAKEDLEVALEKAQLDAQNMIEYFKINKMAIQTDKMALMVIKPNNIAVNPVKIKIDDEVICQQESIKMLGVVSDEKLNFEEHMTKLVKRIRQAQGVIRRVARIISKNLACVVLNAVLIARMTYASFLFLSNKKHLKKLQKMLNISIRFIAKNKISEK